MQARCPLCDVEFDCEAVSTGNPVVCPACFTPFAPNVFYSERPSVHIETAPKTTPRITDLSIGDVFANCQVNELLGQGRFGCVYKVQTEGSSTFFALKVLDGCRFDESRLHAVLAELRSASDLNDIDNVAQLVCADSESGNGYLLTAFVDGRSLNSWLAKKQVDLLSAIGLVTKIATAVAAAHKKGWVHGGLKPSNIIMRSDDKPFLTDFGMTRIEQDIVESMTRRVDVGATLPYLSPEQLTSDDETIDPRSDVYGLGTVLFECITGMAPFASDSPTLLQEIGLGDVETPRSLNPKITERLQNVCLRAMNPVIEERHASVIEFIDELEEARIEIEAWDRHQVPIQWRRKSIATTGILIAIVILIVGLVLAYNTPGSESTWTEPIEESSRSAQVLTTAEARMFGE